MIRFNSDYTEGAHPKVLEKLIQTNLEQTEGYGEDTYCKQAAALIKQKCGKIDAEVHFLVGGTQTNLTLISSALRPHEGVIAAETGHISCHETGAIEATGHKVLTLPAMNGKLTAVQIQEAWDNHCSDVDHEHIVKPKLVYISNSTEVGSIYSKAELTVISETCRENNLLLYVDGARLGYALTAENNDIELSDYARLCDAFYIGGTKLGALFGEALVISNKALQADFRYIIKQKGALMAKGRLLGLQFLALFEDNLYYTMARHANEMANLIKKACIEKGYPFLTPSTTNQQFPILPNELLSKLEPSFGYSFWEKIDENHSAVRFCTSWATQKEAVLKLIAEL